MEAPVPRGTALREMLRRNESEVITGCGLFCCIWKEHLPSQKGKDELAAGTNL
jgi:hypothetical protein